MRTKISFILYHHIDCLAYMTYGRFSLFKSHLDYVNHEIIAASVFRQRFCGDAVFVNFLCGVAVFRAPPPPPPNFLLVVGTEYQGERRNRKAGKAGERRW